jgi:lysozyme family protein
MQTNNFTKAIEFTLPWEIGSDWKNGGYTDDPRDPGGETRWGISKRANPNVDIKNLTLEQALGIYREKYYDIYRYDKRFPIDLDNIDMPLAVAIFDTGVNCGVSRARSWTIEALKTKAPTDELLRLRKEFYAKLPTFPTYGKGWLRRVNDLQKFCQILTAGTV